MLRIVFLILLLIHGSIHLMGFVKGLNLASVKNLSLPISKTWGWAWLIAFLLFILTMVTFWTDRPLWWIWASLAVILSQVLIIRQWRDARWGTAANAIVLVGCLIGWGNYRFDIRTYEKRDELMNWSDETMTIQSIHTDDQLPEPVVRWLALSEDGSYPSGKDLISYHQSGRMRTTEDGNWMDFEATQWFTTRVPGFVWNADVGRGSFMHFTGRDLWIDGKGEMRIDAYAFITIEHKTGPDMDRGVASRYLAEIVWIPSVARQPFIEWSSMGTDEAIATIELQDGEKIEVTFHFAEDGKVLSVEAMRYNDSLGKYIPWVVNLDPESWKDVGNVHIPTRATVTWKYPSGPFTWYEVEVHGMK